MSACAAAPATSFSSSSSSAVNAAAVLLSDNQRAPLQSPPRMESRGGGNDGRDDVHESPAAAAGASSPRVHLHRHALESIFAFLNIPGLATVMAVSRDWQTAVGSMRGIDSSLDNASLGSIQQLVLSRLCRHVTGVSFARGHHVTLELLALLHDRMPHLLRLRCGDGMTLSSGVSSLPWPSRLQQLSLSQLQIAAAETHVLLRSLGVLSQMRDLSLKLQYRTSLSFAPIASLPLLRTLRMEWTGARTARAERPLLSDAQVDQLRVLADVEEFAVSMDEESTQRLLRAPYASRWQRAPFLFRDSVSEVVSALLPSHSRLSSLSAVNCECNRFDWLPRMQSLTHLDIGVSRYHTDREPAMHSLMSALQQCPHLTSLTLYASNLSVASEQMAACLAVMPALSSLQMWYAQLSSLAFLTLPSLAQSLQTLVISDCIDPKPAMSEMRHLHGLHSLRDLTLDHALAEPLDAATRAALQPPSQLLPMLKSFLYA